MSDSAEEPFPPHGVDLTHPSPARIYDYLLGGTSNWEIDRRFADRMVADYPVVKPIAKANRMFLHRAVRHLVKRGVRQFVDIGSGLPTMGHAHEVADELAPGQVKVVYVDHEPIAVAHSRSLLREHGDEDRHTVIHADLRDPDRLWDTIADTGVVDLDQPLALLLIAVLHFRQPPARPGPDGEDLGPDIVARYRDLLSPGSYLAISHATDHNVPGTHVEMLADLKTLYGDSSNPLIWRTHQEVTDLFGAFTLVPPGVTWTPRWHPEEATRHDDTTTRFADPSESVVLAGVARKTP
ncbi:SAM-dependent methyltransferase [Amycolatopsis samaneae]|uniref:SAM-dependent methyltransferase n=1 Tax=Amycolatopsis samaneae TaxID=664691 RepID=A0ABW5G7J3_9PSEU